MERIKRQKGKEKRKKRWKRESGGNVLGDK